MTGVKQIDNSEKGVCIGNDSYSWSYARSVALNATWHCVLPQTAGRERDRKNPQLAETSSLEGRSLAIKSFINCFLWQTNKTSAT